MLDPETFEVRGRWEIDRGPQELAYDVWWHLGLDTMVTSTWGTPNMVKDGVNPELLLAGKYGHKLHVWDLRRRRHVQELDLGAEQQMTLELRPAHDPTRAYGFVGVVLSLKDLSSSIWLWYREEAARTARRQVGHQEGHRDPRGARRPGEAAADPPGIQGRGAARDRHQPVDRRPVSVRLLLGHGRVHPVRRHRPVQAEEGQLLPAGRHRQPRGAPEQAGAGAERRPADGRDQPRRQAHLLHQRLYTPWDDQFYPDGVRGWMAKVNVRPGRHGAGSRGSSWSPTACARTRFAWRAATPRLTGTATPERESEVAMEWNAMLVLGAYHGINPGMGWLFAVALGMQQRSARGVWRALPPIALGHAAGRGQSSWWPPRWRDRGPAGRAEGRRRDDADRVRAAIGCGVIGIRGLAGCRSAFAI